MVRASCQFGPKVETLVVALMLLCCAGCGLSEYEQRMRFAQEERDRILEENSKLGSPVQIPKGLAEELEPKNFKSETFDFFFRAPREIHPSAVSTHELRDATVYRYPRKRAAPSASGGSKGESSVLEMYLAIERHRPDVSREEFLAGVREHFPRGEGETVTSTETYKRVDGSTIRFLRQAYLSASNSKVIYAIHIHEDDRFRVAIVFFLLGNELDALPPVVPLSLKTLALGEDAQTLRRTYQADLEHIPE